MFLLIIMTKVLKTFILISFLMLLIKPSSVFAQISSSAIAIPMPVNEDNLQDGDVICSGSSGNTKCTEEYSPGMFGIYTQNPSAEFEDRELANAKPLITQGIVEVRVTAVNGRINEGSFLTSSTVEGVAMLATRNGYVLGMAMEGYNPGDTATIGKVQVAVNIHPEASLKEKRNNLVEILREGVEEPIMEPLESLRYLLAVLIVLIAFVLGLIYYGRASRAGIEAIGRNPLAKSTIQTGIVMHVLLSIVIIAIGMAIAYMVLVL